MAGTRTYFFGGGLTVMALVAMGWAALPPEEGPEIRLAAEVDEMMRDLANWFEGDPLDGEPDWQANARDIYGGDPDLGAELIVGYGCGACHRVPGIAEARGTVGPDLSNFGAQAYVAGVLPNEPGGLVRWIVNPTAHSPQTAMPDLDVTEAEARDIAAYLYAIGGA